MRPLLLLPLAVALTAVTTEALAVEPPARADDATSEKQRGDAAMDGLRFDEALEAYTHAYALGQDPAVLYNRGRVYQGRSDWVKALDDLEAFERDASPALKARVPKLDQLLASVRERVAKLTIRCDVPGAHVMIAALDAGVTPLAPLRVNAGPMTIRVEAPEYVPYSTDRTLDGGTSTVLDVHLVKKEAALTTPTKSSTSDSGARAKPLTSEWWFWTGVGVLAAGVAITAVLVTKTEKSPANGSGFSPSRVSGPLVIAW